MLKYTALAIALCYTFVLATLCLIKLNSLPNVTVSNADKIFHFLAYGLFTFLWFCAWRLTFNFKSRSAIICAFIWAVFFGLCVEVLQETITDSRSLDGYDVLANTFGALIVSFLLWFKKCLGVKNL